MKAPRKRTRTTNLDELGTAEIAGDDLVLQQQDWSGAVLQCRRVVIALTPNTVEELAAKLWEWQRERIRRTEITTSILKGT